MPGLTSRYRVVSSPREWYPAEINCESDGGHLAIPDDAAEEAWVLDQTAGWLGITDHATEGAFLGVTGVPTVYTNFDVDEPNNSLNDEDCIETRTDRRWNDTGCGVNREFVCECDGLPRPEPAVWCDTRTTSSCGDCSTVCAAGSTCVGQVCVDPS